MGLDRALFSIRDAKFQGNNDSAEPDCSFKPVPPRHYDTDWPTLIIECGALESMRGLRDDAEWWLSNSAQEVKMVILIKVYGVSKNIELEEWQWGTPSRPTTRNTDATIPGPIRTQNVTIVCPTGQKPVADKPFTISFEKLFLRHPHNDEEEDTGFSEEEDITFSIADLEEDFAEQCWNCIRKKST